MSDEIEFRDNSDEVLDELKSAVVRGLRAIGMTAEKHAKKKIREQDAIDTGRLLNSITYAVGGQQTSVSSYSGIGGGDRASYGSGTIGSSEEESVYIGTNVEYAPYVELGTHKMDARPFLKPAATEHVSEYRHILEAALEDGQ